jgi:hypothetical protein
VKAYFALQFLGSPEGLKQIAGAIFISNWSTYSGFSFITNSKNGLQQFFGGSAKRLKQVKLQTWLFIQ